MKKTLAVVAALFAIAAFAQGQAKGPIVDKILFDAKTQADIGLKDVAAGKSDLFFYGVDGATFKALPDDVKSKLDVYSLDGVSYWSLDINPYPNKAPYTVQKGDKTLFNPFAIREVRYALNFLVNRKQIIDEIMSGAGVPMYTPVTPGQPNSSRYGLVASKLGFTPGGNEKKAIADIDAAMNAAAALSDNQGKLKKAGQFWTFNGDPITVNFLIRVDDPNARLKEGRFIADEIERAGFKVNRLEYDRAKCFKIYQDGDPKDYEWNIYTEAWIGGQTLAYWESPLAQMYAPWQAFMPGGGNANMWNYQNEELDSLTGDACNGRVKDSSDYYAKLLKATDLGLKEAVRVFVAGQTSFFAANKDRFNNRMIYGFGDGLNKLSEYTADVKPVNGEKVLRVSNFSSKGALFVSAWDPVGPDGFSDAYIHVVSSGLSDMETDVNPVTGISFPGRASWTGIDTKIATDANGKVVGKVPVPSSAVLWNAKDQKWESGISYVDVKGDGSVYDYKKADSIASYSTGTFAFKFGKWHDGRAADINDYRYALSFPYDVSFKKGADDKVYEESYATVVNTGLVRAKGYVFNKDNTITVYGDANYPMDPNQLAGLLCPSLMVEASNYQAITCWEILEALKAIVAEGNASKTVYSFSSSSDFTEVDLLAQKCVADIKAKLQEFIAQKRVPAALSGFVTPDEAVKDYRLAVDFIEKHGHAFISNGGFILEKYDPSNNTVIEVANRDPSYPYVKGQFAKDLATSYLRIDAVKVPAYSKGKDFSVGITVSEVSYPADKAAAAPKGTVKLTLVAGTETVYAAKLVKAGSFAAVIPAKVLDALKPGSYTLVVEAAKGSEAGSVATSNVIVF